MDGEVQELTLNVSKSAASFRDYTSKSRLVTPYVGADDTPQEVLDLLDTASDTIYWADTGFASPFSDKVEVTLPYGLTEYVNRTQTERKNNTGTGRTSINVVLSGRCDLIAPAGGKVLLAEKLPNVGNTLVIEHGAGVKTIYYGLRRLTVEKVQSWPRAMPLAPPTKLPWWKCAWAKPPWSRCVSCAVSAMPCAAIKTEHNQ